MFRGRRIAPMISVVPGVGVEVIVLAFVCISGGLDISGAALGALLIGFFRTLAIFYFPQLNFLLYFL